MNNTFENFKVWCAKQSGKIEHNGKICRDGDEYDPWANCAVGRFATHIGVTSTQVSIMLDDADSYVFEELNESAVKTYEDLNKLLHNGGV